MDVSPTTHNDAGWQMKTRVSTSLLVLLLVALLAAACSGRKADVIDIQSEIAAIEAEVGEITEIECPLKLPGEEEGKTYYCGAYTVPVDYNAPQADTLNLAFMVLRATDANPMPDPIVYLAGGPDQSGVVSASAALYGDLRQNRDLIFPAQRGTLFSRRLALEECVGLLGEQLDRKELDAFVESTSEREKPAADLPFEAYLAAYSETAGAINARCHEAFTNAGLDPAQFNTANSTDDLVGLLAALGYESFNLHGTSYGTRLALETVRRHPEANIRSVVLDSPAPPTEKRLATSATALHNVVLRVFEDCSADAECSAAYPNLTERTASLLARLAAQPVTAGDETIGPDELLAQLVDLSNTRANYVPRMIAELETGNATTYLALVNGKVGTEPPEGARTSPAVDELVQQISAAAATGADLLAGLQKVADVLAGVQEENPREAMKRIAQEKLADSESLPLILEGIDRLTADEVETLKGMMATPQTEVDSDEVAKSRDAIAKNNALFLLAGMVCLEQLPFEDVNAALAQKNNLAIPGLGSADYVLATEVGNCTNYPMGEPDPSYHEPVVSDIPTLILQGEFDTRTPLGNGLALAEQLSNATLVIVPQAGHETWTSSSSCVAQIGISFLQNPEQAPDLSCIEGRQEHFSLPGEPLTQTTEYGTLVSMETQ